MDLRGSNSGKSFEHTPLSESFVTATITLFFNSIEMFEFILLTLIYKCILNIDSQQISTLCGNTMFQISLQRWPTVVTFALRVLYVTVRQELFLKAWAQNQTCHEFLIKLYMKLY